MSLIVQAASIAEQQLGLAARHQLLAGGVPASTIDTAVAADGCSSRRRRSIACPGVPVTPQLTLLGVSWRQARRRRRHTPRRHGCGTSSMAGVRSPHHRPSVEAPPHPGLHRARVARSPPCDRRGGEGHPGHRRRADDPRLRRNRHGPATTDRRGPASTQDLADPPPCGHRGPRPTGTTRDPPAAGGDRRRRDATLRLRTSGLSVVDDAGVDGWELHHRLVVPGYGPVELDIAWPDDRVLPRTRRRRSP